MDETLQLWKYEWLAKGRSGDTIASYQSEVRRFATWLDGPLESASVGKCVEYLAHRREVLSTSSAQYTWRALRSYFSYVAELDGTANPMARVKTPKVEEPAVTGVSAEDHKRLLAACTGRDAERDRAVLALLHCTGLRRNEVATLTLDCVNTDQGVLLVKHSKTGKPRVVPMSSEARMALLKYLRVRNRHPRWALPQLWLGTKGGLGVSGVRSLMDRRARMAGVDVSAHQYRREFAVGWLSKGGSQVSLMAICGWSSTAMPARYTRHAAGAVAEAEYRRMYA